MVQPQLDRLKCSLTIDGQWSFQCFQLMWLVVNTFPRLSCETVNCVSRKAKIWRIRRRLQRMSPKCLHNNKTSFFCIGNVRCLFFFAQLDSSKAIRRTQVRHPLDYGHKRHYHTQALTINSSCKKLTIHVMHSKIIINKKNYFQHLHPIIHFYWQQQSFFLKRREFFYFFVFLFP